MIKHACEEELLKPSVHCCYKEGDQIDCPVSLIIKRFISL